VVGVETPVGADEGEAASGAALLPELLPTVDPATGELADVVPVPAVLGLLVAEPAVFVDMLPLLVADGFCGVCATAARQKRHDTSKTTGTDLLIIRTPELSEMQSLT
jgi:hypothetical protein